MCPWCWSNDDRYYSKQGSKLCFIPSLKHWEVRGRYYFIDQGARYYFKCYTDLDHGPNPKNEVSVVSFQRTSKLEPTPTPCHKIYFILCNEWNYATVGKGQTKTNIQERRQQIKIYIEHKIYVH